MSKGRNIRRIGLTIRLACILWFLTVCDSCTVLAQEAPTIPLVSINNAGSAPGNGGSSAIAMTPDARYVLFSSGASDLIAGGATRGALYVRDLADGTTKMVDVNVAGTGRGNSFSLGDGWISDDGRYVMFTSPASDLVATDTNHASDVFVRDMFAGTTAMVSVNRGGTDSARANGASPETVAAGMSADGRYVLFMSDATDLVTDQIKFTPQLYVRDMVAGTTIVVSVNRDGVDTNHREPGTGPGNCDPQFGECPPDIWPFEPSISANGRYVVFGSWAKDLVSNFVGSSSLENIFVRDLQTKTTSLVSVNWLGAGANGRSDRPSISADGRFISFESNATDLVARTTVSSREIYVRDLASGTTSLASPSRTGTGGSGGVLDNYPLISADGTHVVFTSPSTELTTEKLDSTYDDLFVRDCVTGTTSLASINAWGTANGNGQSFSARVSANGRFVVFLSRASDLVFNDTNGKNSAGLGCEDVFVRDLQLRVTTLVSANAAGTASANRCSEFASYFISADGRHVVFTSPASDIVSNDTNNYDDVFMFTVPKQFGEVQFSYGTYQANEGDGDATITVTRTGGSEGTVSIDYATTDGTASNRSNYTPAIGTLHFYPGEVTKSFKVLITDDSIANGDRSINLFLSNPSGGVALGAQKKATLTIKDNDTSTSSVNPIDDARFFVRQHYLDFLNREPDDGGFQYWVSQIEQCGADARCREVKRINVSAAFFLSIEFQETGFLVYRMYKAAYGRAPTYAEFLADTAAIHQGVIVGGPGWEAQLELNKRMFANSFVDRSSFTNLYKSLSDFYNGLVANTGITPSLELRTDFGNGKETRASFFRKMAEDPTFSAKQFNSAFVLMQYFGYLRRSPNDAPDSDFSGYNFWLTKLNQFNGNYIDAEMVKAFITSGEYRQRFGP